MAQTKGYGQYCPIAVAAEVMAERWTPLVLRGLFCGATRFNDIQASVPRMSSALLSRRLKELEFAGIIERVATAKGRGHDYALTEAGQELFPVLDTMGAWAQKWLRREITDQRNLDPDVLMWELRRAALEAERRVEKRRVAQFQLDGVPVAKRFYWLVFEPDDVDICVRDPGYEVDIWIRASLRTLIEIWLGHGTLSRALEDGNLELDGTKAEIKAFRDWFCLSHFAPAGAISPAK
jgi:DNA-binding HxlR family transcriptional regulator